MSRCNEIYAGTSGFPRLSHIISMNKHVLFDTYFKNKNKNKVILESLMRNEFDNFYISDEQLSFACKSALIYGGLTADEKALVIDLGIKSNVNVVFFRFYQCWDFYLTGQLSNGEEVLDSISKDLPDFLKFNLSTPHQKRMFGKIFDFNALGCDESAPEVVKLRSYIF